MQKLKRQQHHQGAVAEGEVAHGVVREPAAQHQVVEAADHRQLPWAGRQLRARLVAGSAEDTNEEGSKEEADATAVKVWQAKEVFHGATITASEVCVRLHVSPLSIYMEQCIYSLQVGEENRFRHRHDIQK